MFLDRFAIKRFRAFDDVRFQLNADKNVLTGVNNSGKTTFLEAVALWAECFHRKIWKAARASPRSSIRAGDHSLDYEWFIEPATVRSASFGDLFYNLDASKPIELEARLSDADRGTIELPFTIRYAKGGNYAVAFRAPEGFSYRTFNDFFTQLPDPIQVIHAAPLAVLPLAEEFETEAKVRSLIRTRRSPEALRNRLYRLKRLDSRRYRDFLDSVAYILSERTQPVELEFRGDSDLPADEERDVRLRVLVTVHGKEVPKELALLGSGTLQIFEIMLAVHSAPRELNLVLLDEPDSHIHRDIQHRLLNRLVEHGQGIQLFMTTHDEGLLRSTEPRHVFHLTPRWSGTYRPIDRGLPEGRRSGLQPSPYFKVLSALGSETSLEFLNALEAERLVLVEGPGDGRHIQRIVERARTPSTSFFAMYWAFGGVDTMLSRLTAYRDVFQQIRNQGSLWEKAVIAIDRDWLTDEQAEAMARQLSERFDRIPVFVTGAYTAEATLLGEPRKLLRMLIDMAAREGLPALDEERVGADLGTALTRLEERLRERYRRPEVQAQVFDWQRKRRSRLEALGINGVIPGDRDIQPRFGAFVEAALAQGRRQVIATKEDVEAVLVGATTSAPAPVPLADLYLRLIEVATPSSWLEDWRALRRVVAP